MENSSRIPNCLEMSEALTLLFPCSVEDVDATFGRHWPGAPEKVGYRLIPVSATMVYGVPLHCMASVLRANPGRLAATLAMPANPLPARYVPTQGILGTFSATNQREVNGQTSATRGALRGHPRKWTVHDHEATVDAGRAG
jgi:hypothetical protein